MSLADLIMRLAQAVTPPARAEWARAMRGELEAIQGHPAALGWALGCLATAAGWQLRVNAIYLAAIAALVAAAWYVRISWIFLPDSLKGMDWVNRASLIGHLSYALPMLALATVWPRRVWLSMAAILASDIQTRGILQFFWHGMTHPSPAWKNHPHLPSEVLSVWFLAEQFAPLALAAVVGVVLGGLIERGVKRAA